jgi:predicted PurR-regulated permease PerM
MSLVRLSKNSAASALTAMAGVVITSFVVALLYFGREILVPFAFAGLLSFLLSPVVARLERWVGRVAATLLTVAILFGALGGVGWVLTRQVVDLAARLPDYKLNIETKLKSLQIPGSDRFSQFNKTVQELKKNLPGAEPAPENAITQSAPAIPATGSGIVAPVRPAVPPTAPTPVEVVNPRDGLMGQLSAIFSSLAGSLGTSALVLLLLFCMLLKREDLRGRLIRLIGSGNISATTRGMDDAAKRVSRFLLMQLFVNVSHGVIIAIGLSVIGVPNAFIWGVLTTVLRFIPYVGVWIASLFPIALSLAVSTTWSMPLMTLGLYAAVELTCNNVIEPLLYGSSTGVSSMALILAAVFWTWIWGPLGLILATPLTVCLVVVGRHVPRLSMLSILLSDEQALAPHEEFYHRLLNPNSADTSDFSASWLKASSQTDLYESVFLPALATVERDRLNGQLEKEQYDTAIQEMRDLVEDIGTRPASASKVEADKAVALADAASITEAAAPTCTVICLPVKAERDEIAGVMLAQLLHQHEFPALCLPARSSNDVLLETVSKDHAEVVCLSVVAPSTVVHARALCSKLRAEIPQIRIVVGLWGATEQLIESTTRLRESGANEIVTKLADAILQCSKFAALLALEGIATPAPEDELDRLAELHRIKLLDTDAEPEFDRITKKVSNVLDMPIALITLIDADRQFFKSQSGLSDEMKSVRQTPRNVSICSHVVAANAVLVVPDLVRDRRFARNPIVKDQGLRFYAGAPLRGKNNHVLGSLCVLDTKPRKFGESEKRFLRLMAEEVMDVVNQRDASGHQAVPVVP